MTDMVREFYFFFVNGLAISQTIGTKINRKFGWNRKLLGGVGGGKEGLGSTVAD